MSDEMTKREATLRDLCARHYLTIRGDGERCESTAEEDIAEYFNGDDPSPIGRYAVVTHHDDTRYVIPAYDRLDEATNRGAEYISDDTFTEVPIEVVDLDTGAVHIPEWHTLQWRQRAHGYTLATPDGVVILEATHIDISEGV